MKNKILIAFLLTVIIGCATAQAQSFNKEFVFYIANDDSVSDTLDTSGKKLAAVIFPDSLDGTQLVVYTASSLDSTFYRVQYSASDVSLTFADNKQCGFKPTEINQFLRYIYFEALDGSNNPKRQTAARMLKVVYTYF